MSSLPHGIQRRLRFLFLFLTLSRYRSILCALFIFGIAQYGWWTSSSFALNHGSLRQDYILHTILRIYNRESSYPLVTGDGFRALSDHICDETGCLLSYIPFSYRYYHQGDKVFVKADYFSWYLQQMAPRITVPHILIVHNGDLSIRYEDIAHYLTYVHNHPQQPYRSSSIQQIFLPNIPSNIGTYHPLLTCIPLGIENRQYVHGRKPEIYLQYTVKEINLFNNLDYYSSSSLTFATFGALVTKRKLLYAAFDIGTNPIERTMATLAIVNKPWVTVHISIGSTLQSLVPVKDNTDTYITYIRRKDFVTDTGTDTSNASTRIPPELLQEIQDIIQLQKRNSAPLPLSVFPSSTHAVTLLEDIDASYEQYLASVTNHLFILSPPGNGQQAHRTWETLLLGSIPIVRRSSSPEDHLYDGLPVILVNHYTDITLKRLYHIIPFFKRIMENTQKYKHELTKYDEYRIFPYRRSGVDKEKSSSLPSSIPFSHNYVPPFRPYSPVSIDLALFDKEKHDEERKTMENLEWVFMFHRLEADYWNRMINRWSEYVQRMGEGYEKS